MKDKIFGVLQRVGRSFMLPIALLPVAGLLLGIGSSFTNETMLAAYGLNSVIHPGTLIYTILDVMSQTGSAVFNNLALLFAMGVAIGMARHRQQCNGQHKAASNALQHAKDLVFHLQFSFTQVRIQHIYPHRKDLWRIKGKARKLIFPSGSVSDGS